MTPGSPDPGEATHFSVLQNPKSNYLFPYLNIKLQEPETLLY